MLLSDLNKMDRFIKCFFSSIGKKSLLSRSLWTFNDEIKKLDNFLDRSQGRALKLPLLMK